MICINDDNAVINNNHGRFEDLILLFKIPMGTRTDFFRICRKFGHMPLKRFPAFSSVFSITIYVLTEICFLVSQVLQQQSTAW
jgi:hypothetical protein